MVLTTPSSLTWTLRLKHHKTTVLLHVEPLQTLSAVKAELLSALRETDPEGINGIPLPSSSDSIVLGKPHDFNDISQGWQRIEESSHEDGDEDIQKKGKGKQSRDGGDSSVKGVGLKDGAALAFKWVDADQDDHIVGEEEDWDVVVPSYDDVYPQDEE